MVGFKQRPGVNIKTVVIPCSDITLEAMRFLPDVPLVGGVAICHPHPLYGGSMDNNVVQSISQTCCGLGILSVAFNFRGVGGSGGEYSGGVSEMADLEAVLDYTGSLPEMAGKPLGVAGYSFGGMIALSLALTTPRVSALALVSPASTMSDLNRLAEYQTPWLYISGGQDTHIPAHYAQKLKAITGRYGTVVLETSTDHFWFGLEDSMAGRVAKFMQRSLSGRVG